MTGRFFSKTSRLNLWPFFAFDLDGKYFLLRLGFPTLFKNAQEKRESFLCIALHGSNTLNHLSKNLKTLLDVGDRCILLFFDGEKYLPEDLTEFSVDSRLILRHRLDLGSVSVILAHRTSRERILKKTHRYLTVKEEGPAKGREERTIEVNVEGGCMSPLLQAGDTVKVQLGKLPELGEIALIEGETFFIHQIQDMFQFGSKNYYVHAGLEGRPTIVTEEDILGKIIAVKTSKHPDYQNLPSRIDFKPAFPRLSLKQKAKRIILHKISAVRLKFQKKSTRL